MGTVIKNILVRLEMNTVENLRYLLIFREAPKIQYSVSVLKLIMRQKTNL